MALIVSPDESWGYLGFSTVMPPLPQRFPFGRDNLKNILVRPFKFGNGDIWTMPRMLLFCDLDPLFQGHWWPLKGQIGPVLIYRKLDDPMTGIYNTYICPLQKCRNLTLKLFIEGHSQTAKVPDRGHFWRYFHT